MIALAAAAPTAFDFSTCLASVTAARSALSISSSSATLSCLAAARMSCAATAAASASWAPAASAATVAKVLYFVVTVFTASCIAAWVIAIQRTCSYG